MPPQAADIRHRWGWVEPLVGTGRGLRWVEPKEPTGRGLSQADRRWLPS